MKVKWKCNCGFRGESQIGYWMRCDNPIHKETVAFQVLAIDGEAVEDLDVRFLRIEKRLMKLEDTEDYET